MTASWSKGAPSDLHEPLAGAVAVPAAVGQQDQVARRALCEGQTVLTVVLCTEPGTLSSQKPAVA